MSAQTLCWSPLGAQLLQANPAGTTAALPLFYLSPTYDPALAKPARGGVPVMFPQFATRGPGPKHGLVRQRPWQRVQAGDASSASSRQCDRDVWQIDLPPEPEQHWFAQARLQISAGWQSASEMNPWLEMRLEVLNTGDTPFDFTGGLHPYFAVHSAMSLAIEGLSGIPFDDRYDQQAPTERGFLQGQAFERLYHQAPDLRVDDGQRCLHLHAEGFDNWMVWNPGCELAAAFTDMPLPDWERFVCIEPIVAAQERRLGPGERFVGQLQVRLS